MKESVNLFHLFNYYPIRDRIYFYLSILSIIALSRTCRRLSRTYQDLLLTQWNIDLKLSRFVRHPGRLRLHLRESEAIISGSFAVQFFDRTTYHDSDLDIFVQAGDRVHAIAEYLQLVEGYQLVSTRQRGHGLVLQNNADVDLDPYDIEGLYRVCTFCSASIDR